MEKAMPNIRQDAPYGLRLLEEKIERSKRDGTFDAISTRAYYIWEEEGRPLGRELEHWLLAEKALVVD